MTFADELHQQRWDDHRYYHHNRVNQFLHLVSATCFLISYALIFVDPVWAVMAAWPFAMIVRQVGHFFFEPKTYDEVNNASHEFKESVKVGYNLQRKMVLLSLWAVAPVVLHFQPGFFGFFSAEEMGRGFLHNLSILWLLLGLGAVAFRSVQLFFLMGMQSGLVWAFKILTDPFHDWKIYHKAPYFIWKGEMYDDMKQWYRDPPSEQQAPQS